jgi:Putative lumazine-binding
MPQVLKEVTRVMNLYIDGAGNGNADQMNEAFHSSARWFGTMDGVDYDMDKESFVALMVENGCTSNCQRRRILGNDFVY